MVEKQVQNHLSAQREQKVKSYIEMADFLPAYELLQSAEDLTPLEKYYLAYCMGRLHADRPEEAIAMFDSAETSGLRSSWLLYHRSQLLVRSGNSRRAIQDAIQLLSENPLPETLDLAANCLGALARSEQSAFSETGVVAQFAAVFSFAWQEIRRAQNQAAPKNSSPKILEVDRGDFRAFVYEGDAALTSAAYGRTLPERACSAHDFVANWRHSQDPISLLVAWYVAENMSTAFLDIGSNIGTDAIKIAKLSRLMGTRFPISAFEPGVMAALLPYSLLLNDVESLVKFEDMCVSDSTKPLVIFGELGISVNNRIVNRDLSGEGVNKIVHATTISEYLSNSIFEECHPIMKIDTQGAEWKIWTGMKNELGKRHFSMVLELTPWALRSTVDPARFVAELLEHFMIFDLGYDRSRLIPVEKSNSMQWLTLIQVEKPHWTDLLCVSRSLPSADRLIERICRPAT